MASHKQLKIKLDWIINKTQLLETVTLRDLKIHFGIKILLFRRFDPFAISSFSCLEELLHHLAQKPSRSSLKEKFEDCLAKVYFKTEKYLEISKLLLMRGGAVVFDGIFCQLLPLRIFFAIKTFEV